MAVDEVSYYEYVGAIVDAERRDKLRRALGPANKASLDWLLTIIIILIIMMIREGGQMPKPGKGNSKALEG